MYDLDLPESRKLKWKRAVNKSQSEVGINYAKFDILILQALLCLNNGVIGL